MSRDTSLVQVEANEQHREQLLRNLIMPKASADQVALVVAICRRYRLDPLLKHVVLINNALYVTRDGLRHMAWQSGEFDGYDPPEERRDEDGKWVVTVKVWRKGIARPFVATAYQSEAENTASPVWRSHPRLMTGKVAEVIALRMAFGVSLGGAEEIGFDDQIPQTNIGEARFVEQRAREVPPARLAAPVEEPTTAGPGLPHDEFADLLASLQQMDADGVATKAIVDFADAQWETLDADQQARVLDDLRRIKRARKAAGANRAPSQAPVAPIEAEVVGQPAAPIEVTPLGPADARATERQVKFIFAIGREAQLDEAAVEEQADFLYQRPVDQLNRRQAAEFIEALQRRRNELAFAGDKPASYAG